MRILILLLIGMITFGKVISQSASDFVNDIKKIVPASPDAAALGKYGEIPVSLNSGTPDISIPLYTLQGNYLSMPISLSYHGSGFRVSEVSSCVGLGWVLNAGGVISRSVRGWPDDLAAGYFSEYNFYKDNIEGTACNSIEDPISLACSWRIKASNGEVDLEPDVFSFNFNGYSGRIIFNQDKQPVIIPYQDFIIENPFSESPSEDVWIITTPDGTKYRFAETEVSTFRYGGTYTSAWYLTSIISARNNEAISFTYAENGNQWSENYSLLPLSASLTPINEPPLQNACTAAELTQETETTVTKHLTSICFLNYELGVSLLYANDREDVGGESSELRLTDLVVSAGSTNGKILAWYAINNDAYFTGTDVVDLAFLNKRLKLESVHDNLRNTDYTFEYNEAHRMPSYASPKIDHWGFYNNALNSSLIPDPGYAFNGLYNDNSSASADRETDPSAVKACMLTKITYPTGGYSQFTWEPHIKSFENQPVAVNKSASANCNNGTISMTTAETSFASYLASLYSDDPAMPINLKKAPFVKKQSGKVYFTVNKSIGYTGYCRAYIYKYSLPFDLENGDLSTLTNVNFDIFTQCCDFSCFNSSCELSDGKIMNLEPGVYFIVPIVSKNSAGNVSINVSASYSEEEIVPYKTAYIGGVRIKEIRSSDGINTEKDIVKTYIYRKDYTTPLPADAPSGYERSSLYLFPNNSYPNIYDYSYIDQCTKNMVITSFPVELYGFPVRAEGSHVGYDEVAEVSAGLENGVRVVKFRNTGIPEYRGLASEEFYYDKNLQPVKHIINTYSGYSFGLNIYHKIIRLIKADKVCIPSYCILDYEFYDPAPVSNNPSWLGLTNKTEHTYSTTGSNYIENITQFYYDGAETGKHCMLNRKIDIASDGTQRIEAILYPPDYTTTKDFITQMSNTHIINKPVEQYTILGNKVINGTLISYKTGTFIGLADIVYNLETSSPLTFNSSFYPSNTGGYSPNFYYEPLVSCDQYNNGNLLQYHKVNDINVTYIWAYNNTLPIVKIENIAYGSIPTAVITAIESYTFSGGTTKAQIETDREFLQTTLQTLIDNADYKVTYYTYAPLFGITSETTPNGVTSYYEYDSFGRLQYIKDYDGNILKKYDYHYIGQ